MGSTRLALEPVPLSEELSKQRNRTRAQLERKVERVRVSLANDVANNAKRQAYVKALIRYNEFLVEESVLLRLQPR